MHILTFAFYVASAVAYAAHFARRDRRSGQLATSLLVAAAVSHTFLIGMARMQAGYMPVVGTTAAISFFVWLLALAYLYTEITTEELRWIRCGTRARRQASRMRSSAATLLRS